MTHQSATDAPGTHERPAVVSVARADGQTWYAWRKDGLRPVIDVDAFRDNEHTALSGDIPADYADRYGPKVP